MIHLSFLFIRLKCVIDQEKAYQERKEEENNKKITSLKDELTKLKSFALLVIDEQQRATEQLAQHTTKVQELQTAATNTQEELISARTKTQELEIKVFSLESELLDQTSRFKQEQEAMTAKLTNEDSQNQQLRQKLSVLSRQLDELEESNKTLRRAEEELQDLRDKISRGECGNPNLVSEVEELRKRVLEMEGKDEELIKMEDMCRDLSKKLEKESNQSRCLKAEVDKLNHRIMEIEKLEDAFGKCKQECNSIKCNLDKERTISKHMSEELEVLRVRIKELEASEGQLEKTEWTLKEDLAKLKSLTVMLVDERKTMAEKLKQLEDKVQNSTDKLHTEQDKVTLVTEKLIGESKNALRSKAELEEKMCTALKERDELKTKLKAEQEKNNDLQAKVIMMKKRLQSLEAVEIEFLRNKGSKEEIMKGSLPNHFQIEDNKVKHLTQEVERLKCKLKERNVVDDSRMKADDICESLEKRYSNEQQRAKALMEELELSQRELSNYQLVEKKNSNQHILYMNLKEEEAKSTELTKEVEALKETIHKYMGTEETICHMKTEHATLRRKLTQQEIRNKELAREMETLTRELERYRRFSKSLRPGMNGRRFSDLHISTKEVQTEPTDSFTPNYKNLTLLERAVVNGKLYEDSDNEDEPSYNEISFTKCNPSLVNSINKINLDNNTKQPRSPLLKNSQLVNDKMQSRQSRPQIHQGDKFVAHSPGQPLHIKVTPDHDHNTATLEITSPTSDKGQSFTTTAVIPTTGAPPKQRITIIQNSAVSPHSNIKSSPSTESPCTPDGSVSPLTTYSHRGTPEFRSIMTPERSMSPTGTVSIMTEVPERTHSGEAVEITAGHTVVCLTPQKSNNWQLQRSNSTGQNVITTEDNKIHIHFGHPYIQTMNQPISPCMSPSQEQITSVITSVPFKGNNKIASSIMIKPTSSPISQPSQITVSSFIE